MTYQQPSTSARLRYTGVTTDASFGAGRHVMAPTRTIEGIDLDTRTGLYCDTCGSFSLTTVQVGLVDTSTLELLRTVTGSTCLACGAEGD